MARRKLQHRTSDDCFTLTFQCGELRLDALDLPLAAVSALTRILVHISAGRGVSIVPHDDEIDLDAAAMLIGLDPLDLLDRMTREGVPNRLEGKTIYLRRSFVAMCLAAIRRDLPEDLGDAEGTPEERKAARAIVAWDQKDLVERLAADLRKAGFGGLPEAEVLDLHFGWVPLLGKRPAHWPAPLRVPKA